MERRNFLALTVVILLTGGLAGFAAAGQANDSEVHVTLAVEGMH